MNTISFDAFKTSSIEKIVVFFVISFFSGVFGLFFIAPENFITKGGVLFFSLSISLILSVLLQKKYFLLILPFFFFLMGRFLGIDETKQLGINIFSLGIFISTFSFQGLYQEKIELSFFRDAFVSIKRGSMFLVLGLFFLYYNSFSFFLFSTENISQSIIKNMIDQNFSEEQFLYLYKKCETLPVENKKMCTQKIDNQIKQEKEKMKEKIKLEFEENMKKWTSPESIEKILTKYNISYPTHFPLENMKNILLFLFIFLLILPFLPILGIIGGFFTSLFFSLLIATGQLTIGKKEVKKEIIY